MLILPSDMGLGPEGLPRYPLPFPWRAEARQGWWGRTGTGRDGRGRAGVAPISVIFVLPVACQQAGQQGPLRGLRRQHVATIGHTLGHPLTCL